MLLVTALFISVALALAIIAPTSVVAMILALIFVGASAFTVIR